MKSLRDFILESSDDANITEMSHKRKAVIDTIKDMVPPILEHWALILHARQYSKIDRDINHWKSEILAYVTKIEDLSIKGGDMDKATKHAILQEGCWNDSFSVERSIKRKLNKEGITDKKILKDISFQIASNIEDLVNVLSGNEFVENWLNTL